MHPFSTPRKHQKIVRLSGVFRGYKMGKLDRNGLVNSHKKALHTITRVKLLLIERLTE